MPSDTAQDKNAAVARRIVKRTHVVWASLIGAMTLAGGILLALEDRPASAPAFAALSGATTRSADLEQIFSRLQRLDTARWRGIVIHHSGSLSGSPESIDAAHQASGLNGLGYHFVISNGQGAPNGAIHVGYRWLSQLPGAHTAGPNADHYNNHAIGICLVGDGERRRFTKAQLRALDKLVASLQDRLEIDPEQIVLHRDVAPTSSPGRLFPRAAFQRGLASGL